MGLIKDLNTQAFSEDKKIKQNAKDCLRIAAKLMELNDGSIWRREWDVLTISSYIGDYPNGLTVYKPSKIGRIFLKGITS